MRYIYNIKDTEGKEETIKGMSFKKLLKQLNNKYKPGGVLESHVIHQQRLAFPHIISNGQP